jgi:hypothetical protein
MPQKSAWVPYGLGFAGEFSQIWHPSIGQTMTLVSPHGDKAQSVAWPFTYSQRYPAPSDDAKCHILCNFGTSRIEVWKDRIKIISDNIEEIGNKTITETAGDLIAETCTKADITNMARRYIKLETQDHKDGSAISLKTGNPDNADSTISLQTGDPGTGNSILALATGSPTEGDCIISMTAASPKTPTGKSEIDMISGLKIVATTGGEIDLIAGLQILAQAGFKIRLTASEIACIGHTDVGGLGGPNIARIGDRVSVDTHTGLGMITSGAGNSNAV